MYRYVKRILDLILSIIALIILSPFFLLIGLAIKIESPGPVFFTQQRAGLNKKSFRMYKFRTMYTESPSNSPTWELDNAEQYITRVGNVIRRRSIDELPQLVNILIGNMSFIGPRPVVWAEIDLISERDKRGVYSVLPGLTGLAQINGRDKVTIYDKARMDAVYAESQGLINDMEILILTIAYVLRSEGVVEGMQSKLDDKVEQMKVKESYIPQEERK